MYVNRDISWLNFNNRLLIEAECSDKPLMERFKFLSIFSSNLDEFFRVRFPLITAYSALDKSLQKKIIPPADEYLAETIQEIIDKQLNNFGRIINDVLIPELHKNNIYLYYGNDIPQHFDAQLKEYFYAKVLSFLQPVIIRKSLSEDFFPDGNTLYFIVSLQYQNEERLTHAFINIPTKNLGRFHSIIYEGVQHIFFLDDIVRKNIEYIFSSYTVKSCYSFKLTRNADLNLEEENLKGDILNAIEKKLQKRENGSPSRLLFETGMPIAMQKLLATSFKILQEQMYEGGRYHNLFELANLPIKKAEMFFAPFEPIQHKQLADYGNIFNEIEKKDILLHFPYHSYNPVLAFFNQAAIDPDVKSIYVSIYRVASESHIVNALISAAKNKKDVTVFVELKARFDEANNIKWSKEMKKAGVKIVYSIPDIKVHSKIALIKTKKVHGDIDYAFIGTGNFNENTARFYTDHTLFTSNNEIIKDLVTLFLALEKGALPEKKSGRQFKHLLVSQNNMVDEFKKEIINQIKQQKKGLPALIRIKVNNLEDIEMVNLLYKASKAGVQVQLLVRSVLSLIPDTSGLSENIQAKRIVDRFLEHSRLFIFGANENAKIFMGSADWMTRNLRSRVEVVTPIYDEENKNELVHYFTMQWNDNIKALPINQTNALDTPQSSFNETTATAQQNIYTFLANK
jgi:polyphosphate kinase